MQFVSDVLKSVGERGMTGMLCFKIAGAKYLFNIYCRDGLPYAISFGRQKDGQALDVLLQGSIESYHFIPNLTTRHPEGFSVDALIGRTAHLQVLSGSLHDSGTGSAENRDQDPGQAAVQEPDAHEPVKHRAPTLPADIPWE